MDSSSPSKRRNEVVGRNSAVQEPSKFLDSDAKSELARTRGGLINVPGKMGRAWGGSERKPTKLLLNVNIQNGLGPVHVVMSPENTSGDLIKAVVDVYVKEKRRPLLPSTDPHSFELHYSQFSLEGLKAEEKLKNLGSRNFFLYPKPSNSMKSSCFGHAKKVAKPPFPLTKFMDYLLRRKLHKKMEASNHLNQFGSPIYPNYELHYYKNGDHCSVLSIPRKATTTPLVVYPPSLSAS